MAKIYTKAGRVIVWLGGATEETDQALERIGVAALEQSTKTSTTASHQDAILKLLTRPWFERIWVSERC